MALLAVLAACAPEAEQPGASVEDAPAAREGANGVPPLIVRLHPPDLKGAFRFETEIAGLSTLLVEAGLTELAGVVVELDGHGGLPGTEQLVGQPEVWTATVRMGQDPKALDLELELCRPDGLSCHATSATGSREKPQLAIPTLLQFAAAELGRAPAAGALGQWSLPVSTDDYAVLICGRGAASWYGLGAPVDPEDEGVPNRDPIARAVLIDPSMAVAQWLIGRRHAAAGRWDDASTAFTTAREGRPFQPVFLANQATALGATGKLSAAADAWDGLLQLVPDDARFQIARTRALLAAQRLPEARASVERLLELWPTDPSVAEVRVELADAAGEVQGTDDLLAHWQTTDPTAVEPVRRRVQLRIRAGEYQQAWDFLPELRRRGAHVLADGFQVPLGVALGEWDAASEGATRTGRPEVAARIRARRDLGLDPKNAVDGLLAWDPSPEARVALGRAALLGGDLEAAMDRVEEAVDAAPWDPDVLAFEAEALEASGRTREASQARARWAAVEPASPVVAGPPRVSRIGG